MTGLRSLRPGARLRSGLCLLAVVLVALTGGLAVGAAPAAAAPAGADYAVIVGAAGLRWDDLNPTDTPTLWKLAETGSIGAMSARSARTLTCPQDGWLTLGAGNFAERPPLSADKTVCPAWSVPVEVQGEGAFLPDQDSVDEHNTARPWGARPGALAESVRCSTAIGPGAAVAVARSAGRVDRYAADPPADLKRVLAQCVLSVVDAGTVSGVGADRQAAARRVDATAARVLAARPARSLLTVVGVSDTETPARLHVAIVDGPGFAGGWLVSPSTNRPGYLQLVDVAPTALELLGRARPATLFIGQPLTRADTDRPAALADAVKALDDADQEAGAQRRVADRFFVTLVVVQLALLAVMVPVLRWLRRTRRRHPSPPPPAWLLRVLEVALLASALAIPAAVVTDLVPWWRAVNPDRWFAAIGLVVLAALTAAVWFSRWGRRPLGPLALVAAIAAAVVGVDVLTGSTLQLNGVAGYSTLAGVRYAGIGTIGLGVFAAGLLLGAACLAQRLVPRRRRAWVVLGVGFAGVLLVGAPGFGSDPGGAIALMVGVCVAAALARGGWLTFSRLAGAVLAGAVITVLFVAVDLSRPAEQRGNVGRLLAEAGQGQVIFQRLGQANVVAFVTSPLTLLAVAGGLYGYFVLLRPWGGLRRVYGLHPAVRGGVYGAMAAALLGSLLDGGGVMAAGAAAATVVPVLLLAGLRVVRHVQEPHTGEQPAVKPVEIPHPAERRPLK
ncbi:hypothetical protein Lfu02_72310 [Longispora fulva]|uniref:Uncharacterized protein n=1 Tax=Longispora fulva TaxID=619741 RepID=A0A8J7G6I5_9ACTN|nr:hypothetical protein [Longispora fulva]MBG6133820.1 hypothetical protein [Longispora fulva]GIG62859.1 hypothetical protein Lfu02_72310 [Longispora fulva]